MGIRRGTRRMTRGVAAPSFSPKSLSGLVAWYRADLGVTIGTGVSSWADQSGSGNTASQATGSKQPTRNASDAAYNNKTTLSFASASSQELDTAAFSGGSLSTWTLFIAGNDDGLNGNYLQDVPGNTYALFSNGTKYCLTGSVALTSNGSESSSPTVFCSVGNGASSQMYFSAKTATTTGNAGVTTLASAVIGRANATTFLNGKIAEVALYNRALSAAEIASVLTYMGARYSIAIGA